MTSGLALHACPLLGERLLCLEQLQAYAAERLFVTLRSRRVHETAVSVGGYILGEFGYFIAEQVSGGRREGGCHEAGP